MTAEAEDFLRNAAERAPGSYVETSPIDLCLLCTGNPVRSQSTIPDVRTLLTRFGLRTEPDFAGGDGDTTIRLVPAGTEPPAPPPPPPRPEQITLPQVAPEVRELPSARAGLESVPPGTPARVARDRMIRYGYHHLAVLSQPTVCVGMVTLESIASADRGDGALTVDDAVIGVPPVRLGDNLFDIVETVERIGCVFVLDDRGRYCGEVTAEQVTAYLVGVVEPFYVIGEIERRLRRRINDCLLPDDYKLVNKKNPPPNADRLMFGEYRRLLDSDEVFARLHWPWDRTDFMARLARVNKIRNSVMHFNRHRIPDDELQDLREFCRLLRKHGGSS